MKKVINNLILLCCVILFCLVIGELSIRGLYRYFSNYHMEMWRFSSELKRPLPYEKLPFHHFPNKKGCYYGIEIQTNSWGLRDYEYDIIKPIDKKRIIFLGDSFVFGWGVPFERTFSKQLEQMLNRKNDNFEVINLGTGHYNSIMEVELLKMKGLRLDPDLVILMYFVDDAGPIPRKPPAFEYIIRKHSYLFAFLHERYIEFRSKFDKNFDWRQYYAKMYTENLKDLSSNKKSIKELITLCKQKKTGLLIVNIPELRILRNYPFSFATEYIRTLAEESNIPFLDLLPAFIKHEPSSLWVSREDFHANGKANLIIAEEIYKKILNEQLN